jgi:putative spermidine/putrescine transport system substrate-binding protein
MFRMSDDGSISALGPALGPAPGNVQLGRRQVSLGGAAATLAAVAACPAQAAAPRVVVCNWGGEGIKAQGAAWGQPFTKHSGIPVEFDGSGPTFGKVRTMVESGNVVWDVCDANLAVAIDLGRKGYLEKIDWSIVDKSKVRPGFWNDWGVSHFVYSFVLAYDKVKFKDKPPRSWADFWNVKGFPGSRALSARTLGSLEAALMADGVPARKEALYPLDEKRALAKIKTLKDSNRSHPPFRSALHAAI